MQSGSEKQKRRISSLKKINKGIGGGYKTRGVPPGILFLLRAGLGFTPVVNRLIGDFFWGLRQVPASPPGLNGGVLGGPLPLKMWILPSQGQDSKLKSRSDGQIINFDRGYLVFEIETQRESIVVAAFKA